MLEGLHSERGVPHPCKGVPVTTGLPPKGTHSTGVNHWSRFCMLMSLIVALNKMP